MDLAGARLMGMDELRALMGQATALVEMDAIQREQALKAELAQCQSDLQAYARMVDGGGPLQTASAGGPFLVAPSAEVPILATPPPQQTPVEPALAEPVITSGAWAPYYQQASDPGQVYSQGVAMGMPGPQDSEDSVMLSHLPDRVRLNPSWKFAFEHSRHLQRTDAALLCGRETGLTSWAQGTRYGGTQFAQHVRAADAGLAYRAQLAEQQYGPAPIEYERSQFLRLRPGGPRMSTQPPVVPIYPGHMGGNCSGNGDPADRAGRVAPGRTGGAGPYS